MWTDALITAVRPGLHNCLSSGPYAGLVFKPIHLQSQNRILQMSLNKHPARLDLVLNYKSENQ